MTTRRKSKPKITRKNVPPHTRLKLWVKSAGRCEFNGCNEPVWRNNLTLTNGNFGEVAHIIASSQDGPRGNEESANLQIDFSNLMLMCQRCHTEIDTNSEKYSAKLLREWKWKHENRIEIQTSYPEDIHKSTVVLFSVNIGERVVPINPEAYRNAMFPKFPADEKEISIAKSDFDGHNNIEYWQAFAGDIRRKIKWYFDEGVDGRKIKHLSVFAIGPMPLLMFLGRCIGDTVSVDLYQRHRRIADTNHIWSWPKEEQDTETHYVVNPLHINKDSRNVAIVLSLSGKIPNERYAKLVSENFSVYEITIENPSPHFLKSRKQLEGFSREYRKLLNDLQATYGDSCEISIIPAVPAPIAVECGRVLLPKSDPEIFVYEYDDSQNRFRRVLKIN